MSHVQCQLVEVAKSRSDDDARREDMRVWALQEEIRVKDENLRMQTEKMKELTDKWDKNVDVSDEFH